MGADRKANTWGVAAHSNEVTELPLSPSHSAMMPSVLETNWHFLSYCPPILLSPSPRVVIFVSLRMAASAEAPLSPILLYPILQSMGKVGAVRG